MTYVLIMVDLASLECWDAGVFRGLPGWYQLLYHSVMAVGVGGVGGLLL